MLLTATVASAGVITDLINNLGLPVAIIIVAFYYINKQTENFRADLKEKDTVSEKQFNAMMETIRNNTEAMTALKSTIESEVLDNGN